MKKEIDPNYFHCNFECSSCPQNGQSGIFSLTCTKEEKEKLAGFWNQYKDLDWENAPEIDFMTCPRGHKLNIIEWRSWQNIDMDGYPILEFIA